MPIGPIVRRFLARRPWIYWLVVGALAAAVGLGVRAQLVALADARADWADRREVWVADGDHEPGDAAVASLVELPEAAIPPSVIDEMPDPSILRHPVAAGEVLVAGDFVSGRGPAAGADDDTVVVPVADPLVTSAEIGLDVAVYSEGVVLAAEGRIVHTVDDIVYIAVHPADAPLVAAAAQTRTAAIVFTR